MQDKMDENVVEAEWDGKYPCLCSGRWHLSVNGITVDHIIPDELRHRPMNTAGIYLTWFFDDNWDENWEDYRDGLEMDQWIDVNKYWLDIITTDRSIQEKIYEAIQNQDWRAGSCGGCI